MYNNGHLAVSKKVHSMTLKILLIRGNCFEIRIKRGHSISFSLDFSICSSASMHVVFDSYNMYNALSKTGNRYNHLFKQF